MSEKREARWAGVDETDDRFLQALFAAEELEKLGFNLTALRYEQIDEIGVRLGLSEDQRRQLRLAITRGMGKRSERHTGSRGIRDITSQ